MGCLEGAIEGEWTTRLTTWSIPPLPPHRTRRNLGQQLQVFPSLSGQCSRDGACCGRRCVGLHRGGMLRLGVPHLVPRLAGTSRLSSRAGLRLWPGHGVQRCRDSARGDIACHDRTGRHRAPRSRVVASQRAERLLASANAPSILASRIEDRGHAIVPAATQRRSLATCRRTRSDLLAASRPIAQIIVPGMISCTRRPRTRKAGAAADV